MRREGKEKGRLETEKKEEREGRICIPQSHPEQSKFRKNYAELFVSIFVFEHQPPKEERRRSQKKPKI